MNLISPHLHVNKPDIGHYPAQLLLSGLYYCGLRLRTWKTQPLCGFRRFKMELLIDLMHRNSSLGVNPSEPGEEEFASIGTDWPDMLEHLFGVGDVLTTGHTVLQTTASRDQQSQSPSRPLTFSIRISPGATGSNRDETHYRYRYRTAEIHSKHP
jgi:hypothetical protein